MAETGSWSGASWEKSDLGSTLRAARQQKQNRRWGPARWKLIWPDSPRPEQSWKIGCKEWYISVSGWRMGGGVSTRRVKETDTEKFERWDGVLR